MCRTWLLLWIVATSVLANEPPSDAELKAIDRAHEAAEGVRANFKKALTRALQRGSVKEALPHCRISPTAEAMTVGRTSHRLRNPKNAPPEWTKPYLEKFSQAKPSQIPKRVIVNLDSHRYGYLEPIFVEPICLNCHGTNVDKLVLSAIRMEYPTDQAVGFRKGDFRGLLWLEMKTE